MSSDGHAETLVQSHPGNTSNLRHGAYSGRLAALDPEVQELAAAILAAPHTTDMDSIGAAEIAKLIVLVDRIDADLGARGLVKARSGEVRSLLDIRRRMSAQLERWLAAYGMTPGSRAELMKNVATGGLAAEIAQRKAARRGS